MIIIFILFVAWREAMLDAQGCSGYACTKDSFFKMTLQVLRDLAKSDPAIARKFNLAKTVGALIAAAAEFGVVLTEADVQGESLDVEIDDSQLSQVTGGMRSMGGFSLSSFTAFVQRADGAHSCNTSTCKECKACGAHSCSTGDCKECTNCSNSGSGSLKFI